MLKLEEWMDIRLLMKEGHSIREISRLTGYSRNTVRKVLRNKSKEAFKVPVRESKLDPYKSYVEKRYRDCGLSAVRLFDEIKSMGYTGSVVTLRRFVKTLKNHSKVREKLTVRFETAPGQQGQVDWAYCGRFKNPNGKQISIYAFVMILGFSRMSYVEFTHSMRIGELIECHKNAFEYFGGWPESILYDNMKQVRLSQEKWNPQFIDFCQHYGFIPRTHRPYRPRTKGKVERMVDYLKGNFLNGRSFESLSDLNMKGRFWLNNTVNSRIHGTTKEVPLERFKEEKLTPYQSIPSYIYHRPVTRKVDVQSLVQYEKSRYSVPPEHVGQEVIVQENDQKVIIRVKDMIIAEHPKSQKPGLCVIEKDHMASLWKQSVSRSVKPIPHWNLHFNDSVQITPLHWYQEVSG